MIVRFRAHKRLTAIVLLFLSCGLAYDSATPIFEGLDEVWHYAIVKRLADWEGLPIVRPGEDTAWRQQGTQPPLYYAILSAATAFIKGGKPLTCQQRCRYGIVKLINGTGTSKRFTKGLV